jgi:hypothetical protein
VYRKRFDLSSVQQSEGFENLDHKVQTMVALLAAGPSQFDELASVVRSESQSIKDHVGNEIQQQQRNLAYNDYVKRFLDSLWFSDYKRRQETIKEAHEKTFQWIFETKETCVEVSRWDDFVRWLEIGHHTYWINGKAGSGKSTLMNYVYQDNRTHNSLKVWAGTKELCTPSFFFWNAGSDMEKSSGGLLRSLLHQVLQEHPELTPMPDQITSKSPSAGYDLQTYGPIAAWTERRLQKDLHKVMGQLQQSCRICIFIDGLDEFIGDGEALIEMLKMLQSSELKLCLSSRPHRSYNDAFGSFAKLKLQDLTEADMRIFVSDKLQVPRLAIRSENVAEIIDTILGKAEGVFLWVDLVVKEVLKGLKNGDSLSQLDERLRLLPSDIEGFYAHMLGNIDKIYQKEAADLFQMALVDLTGSLLNVSLVLYKAFEQVPRMSIQDAIKHCDLTNKRIPTICAGLLEIHIDKEQSEAHWEGNPSYLCPPIRYGLSDELAEMSLYESSHHVHFIHRTFFDFLRECEQGKRFMEEHSPSSWTAYGLYIRALLAKVSLLGFPEIPADMVGHFKYCGTFSAVEVLHRKFVYEIMDKVSIVDMYTGTAQVLLCEDIDRTLTFVYERGSGHLIKVHWCARLGLCSFQKDNPPSIPCPGKAGIRLGCTSVKTLETDAMPGHGITGPSSLSISAQSDHSPMNEHLDHDSLGWLSTKPVNMLGLACSYGLFHYVRHILNSRRDFDHHHRMTNLLCCSMWALRCDRQFGETRDLNISSSRIIGSLCMIRECLNRGANPNIYVDGFATTVWGALLFTMTLYWPEMKSAFETIPKVFLHHGADVHKIIYTERTYDLESVALQKGHPYSDTIILDSSIPLSLSTIHEMSTLYFLKEFLGDTPDFKALENACVSKGAHSLSRYTYVGFPDGNGSHQSYEVTDLQHSRFVAAVYNDHGMQSIDLRLRYARKINKIWREITNSSGGVNGQDYSDEEITSDSTESYYSTSSQIPSAP